MSIRSNVLGECLGQILVARRMINPEVLEESLRRMREQKRHQGEILVEMGALSPHNLERALVGQMEAKLYEVFSWRTGSYRFTEDRAAPDQPVSLERPPAALILEGIRRHYEPERQNQVLAAFAGQFVAPSEDARERLQNMSSDPAERRLRRAASTAPASWNRCWSGRPSRSARPACCWWRWPRPA